MRVLVACEESGRVRDAFRRRGHDAWSCDLLPPRVPSLGGDTLGHCYHLQGDVTRVLDGHIPRDMVGDSAFRETPTYRQWDLMIAHPTCRYLCNSGVRWLYGGKGQEKDPERWRDMEEAALFFRLLLDAPIPRIAVENPVMHSHASRIVGRHHDQIVQPWQFGDGETKATALWLRNLPPLVPTNIVSGRRPRVHYASPGPNRSRDRSVTYAGIADAMAAQWGAL